MRKINLLTQTLFIALLAGTLCSFTTHKESVAIGLPVGAYSLENNDANIQFGDNKVKKSNADLMKQYLSQNGYTFEMTEEGSITFRYEGRTFLYCVDEDDQDYFKLVLLVGTDELAVSRAELFKIVNKLTRDYKVAQAYVHDDILVFAVEMLLDSTPEFADLVPRSLRMLQHMHKECAELLYEE